LTSVSSASDLASLDRLESQLSAVEQHVSRLCVVAGELVALQAGETTGVELVRPLEDKVAELTRLVAATRRRLDDVRAKVHETDRQHANQVRVTLPPSDHRYSDDRPHHCCVTPLLRSSCVHRCKKTFK